PTRRSSDLIPKHINPIFRPSWRLHLGSLPTDDGCLPGTSPMVLADHTRSADNAVTGNQESYGIAAYRGAYGSRSAGMFHFTRQTRIGSYLTHGNFKQRLPYPDLKCGTPEVKFYLIEFTPVL